MAVFAVAEHHQAGVGRTNGSEGSHEAFEIAILDEAAVVQKVALRSVQPQFAPHALGVDLTRLALKHGGVVKHLRPILQLILFLNPRADLPGDDVAELAMLQAEAFVMFEDPFLFWGEATLLGVEFVRIVDERRLPGQR